MVVINQINERFRKGVVNHRSVKWFGTLTLKHPSFGAIKDIVEHSQMAQLQPARADGIEVYHDGDDEGKGQLGSHNSFM